MTVEEIKCHLKALSPEERDQISKYLVCMRLFEDSEFRETIDDRLADKDPAHWLTLEEFERRLGPE